MKTLRKMLSLPLRADFHFNLIQKPPPTFETVIASSLPVCLDDASPPGPDPKDKLSTLAGAFKRLAVEVAPCSFAKMKKILAYSRKYIHPQFKTITPDQIPDTLDWINNINHPESRKQELRQVYELVTEKGLWPRPGCEDEDVTQCNSFVKDEKYLAADYKPSRWINSSSDLLKVVFGPIADRCMEELVKCRSMIKTVPVAERAKAIYEHLGGSDVIAQSSDAKSMEDHYANIPPSATNKPNMSNDPRYRIANELMLYMCGHILVPIHLLKAVKFLFYRTPSIAKQPLNVKELWKDIKDSNTLNELIKNILNTYRRLKMRHFGYVLVNAILCSGEMDTSFRNTSSMYVMVNFASYDLSNGQIKYALSMNEGDDALTVYKGKGPDEQWWHDHGWLIEIEFTGRVNEASFCGLVFAPEDLVSVPDIRAALCKFGWTNRRYVNSSRKVLMGLLRSKALSMACEYGNVPILGALAQRLLTLTRTINVRQSIIDSTDMYHRENLQNYIKQKPWLQKPEVGWQTRLLVQKLQNIPVSAQLEAEATVSSISIDSFFSLPMLDFPAHWIHNNSRIQDEIRVPRQFDAYGRARVCKMMRDKILSDIGSGPGKVKAMLNTLERLRKANI